MILWKDAFAQLSNSKVEANFADQRTYTYNGEPIDTAYHLGYDLSVTKNTAVEAGEWVVDQAVQLHGGMGYMRECEVERHYRDMRILGIGGGTSEIMTGLAAKMLGFT